MLSILIPTYNYDCTALVKELVRQIDNDNITAEIIVADDCSTIPLPDYRLISPYCKTIKPEHNLGRAAIRNYLAKEAKYDYLLFIDSDSFPANNRFLSNYIDNIHDNDVLLGGRLYHTPIDNRHTLLPKYGRKERTIKRAAKNNPPFTSPNLFIDKKIFNSVMFREDMKGYGHEDTVFGIELRRGGYKYHRIDNPVYHLQIEDNLTFLSKTRDAVGVLYDLYTYQSYPELETVSPLLNLFIKTKKLKIDRLLSRIYKSRHTSIEKKLDCKDPDIKLFALYKLLYLCYISESR